MVVKKLVTKELFEEETSARASYAARLIIQGKHRFFTLSMPSDVLAATCVVDTRAEKPLDGFQRVLDETRAHEIARYIDFDFGTIPTSVVLSAQPEAELKYNGSTQSLSFKKHPRAFLILDGQHRIFGFHFAQKKMRVPVVVYSNLKRSEEARLFIDINTKQRPVPNELLLEIARMAQTETAPQALLHDIFDLFAGRPDSALFGQMSAAARVTGKISRVTFNAALRPVRDVLGENSPEFMYDVLNAYLQAWKPTMDKAKATFTNPTLFRAIFLFFPTVVTRVKDKYGDDYTVDRFAEILTPFFARLSKARLRATGGSPIALCEIFKRTLQKGFAIGAKAA